MNTHSVLMNLSEDGLLKPFARCPAWPHRARTWRLVQLQSRLRLPRRLRRGLRSRMHLRPMVSALARVYAITGEEETRQKVLRLNRLYARPSPPTSTSRTVSPPTRMTSCCSASSTRTPTSRTAGPGHSGADHNVALPQLPGHAIEHGVRWRMDKDPKDDSWTWDESYTLSENLFLAYQRGAGRRYYDLGLQYLDDKPWYDPLSRNENVFDGRHAYSHVNSLCSAMMAYLVAGSEKAPARRQERLCHAGGAELCHRRLGPMRPCMPLARVAYSTA